MQGNTPEGFLMDGGFDSEGYRIIDYNMHLYAALKGSSLYLATWGTGNGGNDHFLYAAPELGDATDPAPAGIKRVLHSLIQAANRSSRQKAMAISTSGIMHQASLPMREKAGAPMRLKGQST